MVPGTMAPFHCIRYHTLELSYFSGVYMGVFRLFGSQYWKPLIEYIGIGFFLNEFWDAISQSVDCNRKM